MHFPCPSASRVGEGPISVTEALRLVLRTSLVVIGEPATDVLMEAMPPIDYDNLATKADLDTRFSMVDTARCTSSAELRREWDELRREMAELRSAMRSQTRILLCSHLASMAGLAGLILRFG